MNKKKIDWTIFIILPAAIIASLIVFVNAITGFKYGGVLTWLLAAVWFITLSNNLLNHKEIGRANHILGTIAASGSILLMIFILVGNIS